MLWLDERIILDEIEVGYMLVLKELDAYNEAISKGEKVSKPSLSTEQILGARGWFDETFNRPVRCRNEPADYNLRHLTLPAAAYHISEMMLCPPTSRG